MQVLNRGTVHMDQLAYGDQVLSADRASGELVYREVFLFGHREQDLVQEYVNLKTAAGHTLQVSWLGGLKHPAGRQIVAAILFV
jgi:hypothetical protein